MNLDRFSHGRPDPQEQVPFFEEEETQENVNFADLTDRYLEDVERATGCVVSACLYFHSLSNPSLRNRAEAEKLAKRFGRDFGEEVEHIESDNIAWYKTKRGDVDVTVFYEKENYEEDIA